MARSCLFWVWKNIKLLAINQLIDSNTITILIDGFLCEDNKLINEWQDFINFFNKETMFYYFGWQGLEKNILIKNKSYEKMEKKKEISLMLRKGLNFVEKF